MPFARIGLNCSFFDFGLWTRPKTKPEKRSQKKSISSSTQLNQNTHFKAKLLLFQSFHVLLFCPLLYLIRILFVLSTSTAIQTCFSSLHTKKIVGIRIVRNFHQETVSLLCVPSRYSHSRQLYRCNNANYRTIFIAIDGCVAGKTIIKPTSL